MTRPLFIIAGLVAVVLAVDLGVGRAAGQTHSGHGDSPSREIGDHGASAAGHAGHADPVSPPTVMPPPSAGGERKVLYYRNPMGLPDISPVPKKDSMGMDYVPVYADEAAPSGTVRVGPEKVQKLGVRSEPVATRRLVRSVRAVGTVEIIEKNLAVVSPRFAGWAEKLYADTTGLPVKAGQPLLEVYSPSLVVAQQDYLTALKGGNRELAEGAVRRLRNWEISEAQIARLKSRSTPARTLTLTAPVNGFVVDKKVVQGMYFEAGMMLYQIADLSRVWVVAEVFEQDLGLLEPGVSAVALVNAFPGRRFPGKVAFLHPSLTPETRTTKVHIELDNAELLLRPALSAAVEFAMPARAQEVLAVPESAVLDSGRRRIVLVDRGGGLFEPREVHTGVKGDDYLEILSGVQAGERVVARATFLIDAESNLRAALEGFAPAGPQ